MIFIRFYLGNEEASIIDAQQNQQKRRTRGTPWRHDENGPGENGQNDGENLVTQRTECPKCHKVLASEKNRDLHLKRMHNWPNDANESGSANKSERNHQVNLDAQRLGASVNEDGEMMNETEEQRNLIAPIFESDNRLLYNKTFYFLFRK